MPPIVLVMNDYITLEYRPEEKMLYHTIHQPIGIEQIQLLKDALNAGTNALKQYGITKWLSDDRLNGPLTPEFLNWSLKEWCPRTIGVGWKYWANVVPRELTAAGTLMPVINNLHKLGLTMQVFTKLEEGVKWLSEK